MSKTSNVGDLMARLQQKIEQDRIEIEAVTQSELKKLAENLRQSVQDESYIIVRDIKEHTRWMNAALWGAWGSAAWCSGCVSFSAFASGADRLTRWYSNNIQSLHPEATPSLTLPGRAGAMTRTRSASREQTWGVWLHEAEDQGEVRSPPSQRDAPRQKLALESARTAKRFCYRASEGAL